MKNGARRDAYREVWPNRIPVVDEPYSEVEVVISVAVLRPRLYNRDGQSNAPAQGGGA